MHRENMIVAMDKNRGIGKDGKMPGWKLSADMVHFVSLTTECGLVAMGRKTWDSLSARFKPLPGRMNVVFSQDKDFKIPSRDCLVLNSVEHFLKIFKGRQYYVIGGEQIYNLFSPYVSRLIVTHVDTIIEGADAFFPEIGDGWKFRIIAEHAVDEHNQYPFVIKAYTRKPRL